MVDVFRERVRRLPSWRTLHAQAKPLPNVNQAHEASLTALERAAAFATVRIGSMGFFLPVLVWTVLWLSWNVIAPAPMRFDPFPAFVLWLFISNLIQILLMPLLMVGQNLQGRHAELRAELDYAVNLRAEKEVEAILLHLEHQNEVMLEILRRIEAVEQRQSSVAERR